MKIQFCDLSLLFVLYQRDKLFCGQSNSSHVYCNSSYFLVMLMNFNYLEFNGFARFMCTLSFRVGRDALENPMFNG